MDFIQDNWVAIFGIAALFAIFSVGLVTFLRQPREKQLAQVREWLLYAVTMAEAELGNGTGKLKLRFVYDQFIVRFPQIARMITFEMFSGLVDQALEEMRHMLDTNKQVANIVAEKKAEPVAIVLSPKKKEGI